MLSTPSTSTSDDSTIDFKKQWEWYYAMTISERGGIGRRCKRLLDEGRIDYIKTQLPDHAIRLVKYVDAVTSLENILLLVHEEGQRKKYS